MEEWKEYKLGDVCDFQEGYVNPPQGNPEYFDGDVKWLRATDLNDGYVYSTTRTLTQLGFKSARKSAILFKPGTIAISKSGTIGRLGILQDYMCGNRAVINIIPHHTVNTYFVFLVLRSYQRYFPLMAVGSVQKNLYISILEDLKINLPDLNTQDKIVSILSSLDDKIELNRKINANLEAQAQALFKSWFVDFEPFKDQPFVESELGMIPEGWRVGTLGEIIVETESGSRPKGGAEMDGIPSIGAEKIERLGYYEYSGEKYINAEYFANMKRGHVKDGDVLLYKDGAYTGKSSMALDGFPYKECAVNEHVFLLRTESSQYQFFLYCLISYPDIRLMIHTLASAKAAQPGLNQKELLGVNVILPPKSIMKQFEELVSFSMHKIASNANESRRLASLRDTLLPRLMSGELNVFDKPNDNS